MKKTTTYLTPQLDHILTELAIETGKSREYVLKLGVALISVANKARKNGQGLGVFNKDDPEKKIVTEIVGMFN